jgi:peptide methionine sulfoxide reductase MsrA
MNYVKSHRFLNYVYMKSRIVILLLFLGVSLTAQQRIELGNVKWERNYDTALQKAKDSDKPLFILFQEVPGCSTCQNYGKNVLSNPLIVEAIEDLFVPLVIHNNKTGHDEEILKKFNEPSWNNPVVRILSSDEKQLVPRVARQYSAAQLVAAMNKALANDNRGIPGYLNLLEEELTLLSSGVQETYISMYCYWSGEKNIAKHKGVAYTEAGFMDGKEVVKVTYSPTFIDYETLLDQASKAQCASASYSNNRNELEASKKVLGKGRQYGTKAYRKAHDDKYYLNRSDLKHLDLTDLQKSRINSMLGQGLDPSVLLSPRQIASL